MRTSFKGLKIDSRVRLSAEGRSLYGHQEKGIGVVIELKPFRPWDFRVQWTDKDIYLYKINHLQLADEGWKDNYVNLKTEDREQVRAKR